MDILQNFTGMDLVLDNDYLLTEIFLRLPAKSLTRFKSVCKKWLCLISLDYFCHLHTLRCPKLQLSLILHTHSCECLYWNPTTNGVKSMIPYSLSVPASNCTVAHACNGLMLLKFKQCDEPLKDGYYVYNPATRRSRMISLTHNDEFPHVAVINLAFDPSNSPYYKIVCIKSTGDPLDDWLQCTYQIEVYDSESQTWKRGLQFTDPKPCPLSHGTHWNNAIYWQEADEDDDERCHYCYFDIDRNEMKTLSSPQPYFAQSFTCASISPRLVEFNGHLYHIERYMQMDGDVMDIRMKSQSVVIWELDHHSQWLLKNHHALTYTAGPTEKCITFEELIRGSGSDGEGVYSMLTTAGCGKIRVYSFLDESYYDFTSQPFYQPDLFDRFDVCGYQFGETLALV